MNKQKIEILAPAGSPQALDAAIACGANAVYLGVDALNARRNAENFTVQTLPDTVRRCHIAGVRVYLTLNILLRDEEFPQLVDIARHACRAGVDAVIVQDLGAAAFFRRCAPGMRLHASTQMAVHNPEGVRLLKSLGFSRVVLARECSREEIAEIVESTSLEVETFVHGAQCMCVSGQCYMSAIFGQRSGNRGLCAQPCRLPFVSQATGHALSLKDMSLIEHVDMLAAIGVRSLKIEGRMKRPEYVAAAVTACRAACAGKPVDLNSLQAVFSRSGFTDGYFKGERSLALFGIREKEDVTAAASVLGKLEGLYNDPRQRMHPVGVDLTFTLRANQPAALTATDCDGFSVTVTGETAQMAQNKPTDRERAAASLGKTGGTPYFIRSLECEIEPGLMLPASAINALRRAAFEQLDQLRGKEHPVAFDEGGGASAGILPAPPVVRPADGRQPVTRPALRLLAARVDQLSARMRATAQMIILPPDELEGLWNTGAPVDTEKLCVGVPRMLFDGRDAAQQQLIRLRKLGICRAQAGNLGAFWMARELGFIVHIDPFFNLLNSEAVAVMEKLGAVDLTASWELTLDGAKKLNARVPLGITVYGHLPLMTVRACPMRISVGCARCKAGENTLTDRKGEKMALSCAWGCAELYNPQPLYMGDRLEELNSFDFITLRFTVEEPARAKEIFTRYTRGGEAFDRPFTRGLLYKAVL